ncbi:protein phosphatase domain containing protein [Entamoeba histolytica HM-1:IMSS-B]|uniref:Protein phosphatase domain-containing protein n=6 Tax=Entamoeba histolytica TaxID=5759 RepID=C4LZT7_ENTH1|nr:protein phosphatase domain-containing protein [Entamoeba histolytica HM-1:IMSS]EMD48198.1 protein phosphatase domain containing protein [Entamoeba histolytica KU27]EMH72481.1 protein phosphatase domain containing protein [Entamoeba histolytica HM-1:IMSS-B]ENY65476.1 protein phosphatase domain containing protein [Entamoeba histolytica HM-1:IMSS-A]BAN38127.1 protein phosphatase domain-containing protein [Entamoeba histolytica]EAL49324.1 protein phosphatase domain-containing protein [Entamoeba|eukprot:XP_654715.1 protein phosphatase domain-containing protein [Entamoeba histolytica HM-1:IMSS]
MFSDFLSTPLDSSSPRMAYSASPRSRKPAIYRGTPPTFTSTLRCVQSGTEIGLPEETWEVNIEPDGTIKKEGKTLNSELIEPLPRFAIGIAQTRGVRENMEDVISTCHLERNKDLVGVFDGHNGDSAARIAATLLKQDTKNYTLLDDIHFIDLFNHLQKKIVSQTQSGTTATVLYLGCEIVKIAYVGDCSVYLIDNNGINKITVPHRCGNILEEKRILTSGGTIEDIDGIRRVNGIINITRSLGDKELHPPLSFEPEIYSVNVKKGLSHIVIISDGADTVNEKELEKMIRRSPTVSIAAAAIRNEAFKQKSKDNISVVVVDMKFSSYERKTTSPLVDDLCIAGGDEDNPFDF